MGDGELDRILVINTLGQSVIESFDGNEVDSGIRIAHRIKGTAANVADTELHEAASHLESSLREHGDWTGTEKLADLLDEHLHEVRLSIDSAQNSSP